MRIFRNIHNIKRKEKGDSYGGLKDGRYELRRESIKSGEKQLLPFFEAKYRQCLNDLADLEVVSFEDS